jgi:hypothetical protein
MQVFRLAGIICLLVTFSFAQKVIDVRGKSYSEIYGHLLRYGGSSADPRDPRREKILSGILTITDPGNLVAGSRFDYELVVTNDSNESMVIPQTLDWSEIDDGHTSQTFVRAILSVQMECSQILGELNHFALYGSDKRPETEVTLKPGESVRILGSSLMPLPPTEACQSEDTATFGADFEVYATTLKREPVPAMPEGYAIDERKLIVANAKKKYPITNPR